MMLIFRALPVLLLFLSLRGSALCQEVRTTQMWSPHLDWEVKNHSWQGNPYDVSAKATFIHEDGTTKHVTELFYAGNNIWKFRFTGTKTGDWTFRTESDDPDLDNITSKVTVSPNPDPEARGFLTHVGNQYAIQTGNEAHLEAYPFTVFMDRTKTLSENRLRRGGQAHFAPKTPQNEPVPDGLRIGSRDLALDFHNWNERTIRACCDHAKNNGLEIIFVHVNNQWFKEGVREWSKHDSENPDLGTFQRLEQIVITTYQEGCRVHFWAWGDESRKWTPKGVPGGVNGIADRRLQRYIAARLGPLPGWTMGYGFDLHEWTNGQQLNRWAEYLHEHFGWQHLLAARGVSLHGKNNIRSYDGFGRSVSVATTSHGPQDYQEIVDDMAEDLEHPHLYEERHSYRRQGFKLDMDGTRRLLWWEIMAGGMGGFFGFYPKSSSAYAGHPYPNPEQLRTHRTFWHKHKRLRLGMKPASELTKTGCALKDESNKRFIFYGEDAAQIHMDLSNMTAAQAAVAVDTRQEYSEMALGRLAPREQTWKAPYASDWAVAIGP